MVRSLALLVSLAAGLSAAAAPPLIRNPYPIAVGGGFDRISELLVEGDFGGDAANDLVVVQNWDTIRTLINVADGPFSAPVTTPVAEGIVVAAPGHVDTDGFLDLVVGMSSAKVGIYHGNGDGTFRRGAVIATTTPARTIAVADFNADGKLDVAAATHESSGVTVHLGGGDGSLGPAIVTALGDSPLELLTADFNRDGKADLVLSSFASTRVAIGLGNGGFSAGFTANGGYGAVTGDFDEDTKPDLFLAADGNGMFHLHRGAGDGTFLAPTAHRLIRNPGNRLEATDVDGDGHLDVVGAAMPEWFERGGALGVLRGNGNGTFDAPEYWLTEIRGRFSTGDFDRDGMIDLVYGRTDDFGAPLLLLHGTGGGAFDGHRAFDAVAGNPEAGGVRATSAADVNGDGKPDLVLVTGSGHEQMQRLVVFLNDGAGNWSAPLFTNLRNEFYMPQPAFGDVNGDGKLDVVVAGSTYLGNGDGTFRAAIYITWFGSGPALLGDISGDGKLDLLSSIDDTSHFRTYVLHGTGTGSFTRVGELEMRVDAVADFNGDGRTDVVGRTPGSLIRVGINNGSGGFSFSDADPAYAEEVAAMGDFNGDSRADLLLALRDGTRMVFGRGDGTFGNPVTFESNAKLWLRISSTADVDGDGALDVVTGGTILLGDGTGRFRASAAVHGANGFSAVADFDGDGDVDLAVANGAFVALVRPGTGPDPLVTPALTIAAIPAAPRYGVPVTHSVGISPPTVQGHGGSLLLSEDGVPRRLLLLDETRSMRYDTVFSTGIHTITVSYSGDSHHLPVTTTLTHNVPRGLTSIHGPERTRACAAEIVVDIDLDYPSGRAGVTFRVGNRVLPSRPDPDGWGHYLSGLSVGTHSVTAEFPGDDNYEPASWTFTQVITVPFAASVSAGSAVYRNETGNIASVAATGGGLAGATFAWSVTNGTIESGQGTSRIHYTAGGGGEVTLQVTIAQPGTDCSMVVNATVPIVERLPGASMFYIAGPCRLIDTRGGAPHGGGVDRSVTVAGHCSVPAGARSVVANVTLIAPATSGWMSLYPADLPWPGTSTVNYRTGKTRANNAVVSLSADGRIVVRNSGPDVHYVIDVYGYFK